MNWYLVVLILLMASFSYFFLSSQYWDKDGKLSVAIWEGNGDVLISTFDPVSKEIANIQIPGETQVEVARKLGTWKLASVWQLGENEGFSGKLLAETLTYHFKFPVVAWADSPALGFSSTNLAALVRAVFMPYKTNLKIADRFHIAAFALQVANPERVDVALAETTYLKRAKFIDGGEGYVIVGTPSPALSSIFADPEISAKATTVIIRDATGVEWAGEVGRVVEVLGAKVASVVKEKADDIDCIVSGKDDSQVRKLASVFSCSIDKGEPDNNFDIEIRLGLRFATRY